MDMDMRTIITNHWTDIADILKALDEYRNKYAIKGKKMHRTASGAPRDVQVILDKLKKIPVQLYLDTVDACTLNMGDTFRLPNSVTSYTCCVSDDPTKVEQRYFVEDGIIKTLNPLDQVVVEQRAKPTPAQSKKKSPVSEDYGDEDDEEDGRDFV